MAVYFDPNLLASPATWPVMLWLVVAVALLAGVGIGLLLSGGRRGSGRARELERELESTREEFEAYRERVSGHFTDTSKHLRDLALQYRTVYEHLADGARTLCPDSAVPIEARGLARDLLPASVRGDDELEIDEAALASADLGVADRGASDVGELADTADLVESIEDTPQEPARPTGETETQRSATA